MKKFKKQPFSKKAMIIFFFFVFGSLMILIPFVLAWDFAGDRINGGESRVIEANIGDDLVYVAALNTGFSDYFIPNKTAREYSFFVSQRPASISVLAYCGDGYCQGNAGEFCGNCPDDCGRCADSVGACYSMTTPCNPSVMATNQSECQWTAPFCHWYSGSGHACVATSQYSLSWMQNYLTDNITCQGYTNLQDCIGNDCYWYVWPKSGSCGDGYCKYSEGETVENCQPDCSSEPYVSYKRRWFCEGGANCLILKTMSNCEAAGCTWNSK